MYVSSLVCMYAVDEGDLFDGEVHPIPHCAEEGHREAQVHHVGHPISSHWVIFIHINPR